MSSQYTFRRSKKMGRKEDGSDITTQIEYPLQSHTDYSKWIFWLMILLLIIIGSMAFMMFTKGIVVKVRG